MAETSSASPPPSQWHTREYFLANWTTQDTPATDCPDPLEAAGAGPEEERRGSQGGAAEADTAVARTSLRGGGTSEQTPAVGLRHEAGEAEGSGRGQRHGAEKGRGQGPGQCCGPGRIMSGFLDKGRHREGGRSQGDKGKGPAERRKGASSRLAADDPGPLTAAGEKERGNEMYRQGRFEEAVRCYSHSLALEPTAVAFANRAMAFLKLGRYEEAESDCSEALERDDEYVKALSRRATSRLRLKKPLEALQDINHALALEPSSRELLSLKAEAEKAANIAQPVAAAATALKQETKPTSAAAALKTSQSPVPPKTPLPRAAPAPPIASGSNSAKNEGPRVVPVSAAAPLSTAAKPGRDVAEVAPLLVATEPSPSSSSGGQGTASVEPGGEKGTRSANGDEAETGSSSGLSNSSSSSSSSRRSNQGSGGPTEALVAKSLAVLTQQRLASAPGVVGLTPPQRAYEFESTWRTLCSLPDTHDDAGAEAGSPSPLSQKLAYLKMVDPKSLPGLLKDSLSGPLLLDILHVLLRSSALREDPSWAVMFLDSLRHTPRFSIASLSLTASSRSELSTEWLASGGLVLQTTLPPEASAVFGDIVTALRLKLDSGVTGSGMGS